jgi:quercetin dioxygenase-like cupin family protein
MDVWNSKVEPTIEHEGTCLTYFLYPKESVRKETMGSYLEYVAEFELKPGAKLHPHFHDSEEFYRILSGKAIAQVGDEQTLLNPGDLLRIPRNAMHSIWPAQEGESFRALSFAVSFMGPDPVPTNCELPKSKNIASVEV